MTILVACGLMREARIIARTGVIPVAGGGDTKRLEDVLDDTIRCRGPFSAIVSSGIAGALDPALRPGDVVIGTLATAFPGEGRGLVAEHPQAGVVAALRASLRLDTGLRRGDALVAGLRARNPEAHVGTITGRDTIAATLDQKRALRAATGALAVDMESHVAARVAARHDLPFAILRTISDGADDVLPPAALVGMKPDGGMAPGAVLASLARRPGQLAALIRTGRDAARAFTALERVWVGLGDLACPI